MAATRVSQSLVEVLVPTDAFSPATPTGAGVSQRVVEVLGSFPSTARASQLVVEVLMSDDDSQSPPPSGGGGGGSGPVSFGYSV